jgi:hypothetical protein
MVEGIDKFRLLKFTIVKDAFVCVLVSVKQKRNGLASLLFVLEA